MVAIQYSADNWYCNGIYACSDVGLRIYALERACGQLLLPGAAPC